MKLIAVAALLVSSACTTLGPMPATTGISAVPSDRPGFEAQTAAVPGFYLSTAAEGSNAGNATGQLSILLEPDRWLGIPGLIVGAREFGQSGDTLAEPFIGFRHRVGDGVSLAAIGYGTATTAATSGASYSATRLGTELAADVQLLELAGWVSLHWQVSASFTDIEASGSYCISDSGAAVDCQNEGMDTRTNGNISGIFPAGTAQLSLDLGHRPSGVFHDARVAVLASAGQMPQLSFGQQEAPRATYTSWGLSVTLGLGADH
ncbi:MAG TPA: hypothetical protein VGG74_15100 [Kofleriaceae bacterium]|jgi:hypothetical protein